MIHTVLGFCLLLEYYESKIHNIKMEQIFRILKMTHTVLGFCLLLEYYESKIHNIKLSKFLGFSSLCENQMQQANPMQRMHSWTKNVRISQKLLIRIS